MTSLHGFIMLHRKILDWEWFSDRNVRDVFIVLLLLASFKPTRWQGVEIAPGQAVISYEKLAARVGISVMQVRTALKKLEQTGEITVKTTNKFSLVTIEKWAFYQSGEEKITNKQQTNNNQRTNGYQHRNNVNNVNNVNKKHSALTPRLFSSDKYDYDVIYKRARERIRKRISSKNSTDDTSVA